MKSINRVSESKRLTILYRNVIVFKRFIQPATTFLLWNVLHFINLHKRHDVTFVLYALEIKQGYQKILRRTSAIEQRRTL